MSADLTQAMMGPDVLGYAELCRPGAIEYLERHKIPQLFRSLVAVLMVKQPQDHVTFIKQTLSRAMELGVASLDWETFVYPLHPKRSPGRLEFVRDGTAYERQGVELMQQQRRRRHRQEAAQSAERSATSPPPPPLSPAASLTSAASGVGAGDTFRLTQGQWEDADSDLMSQLQPQLQQQQEAAPIDADSNPLPTQDAQEFVSSEVDKLLSEAIIMSVAARERDAEDGSFADEAALIASLQANLAADLGRSDVGSAGTGAATEDDAAGLFD